LGGGGTPPNIDENVDSARGCLKKHAYLGGGPPPQILMPGCSRAAPELPGMLGHAPEQLR
jgi:hypothetical protein